MQVKVQTVNELTINQLSEDQYKAEKAAGRIKSGEVYACTPSPVKWEDIQNKPNVSGGGDVDYAELARRIPSWQWKVTLPKSDHQTVTATVNGQTYTSDFYAPQGSNVTFSVKADYGFFAGALSKTSITLDQDEVITVTDAKESGNVEIIEAGSKEFEVTGYEETFIVPPKVKVLKWTWNEKDVYTKVNDGDKFLVMVDFDFKLYATVIKTFTKNGVPVKHGGEFSGGGTKLTVSWSTEINEHPFDYDWTK